jgi:hypothetical protein
MVRYKHEMQTITDNLLKRKKDLIFELATCNLSFKDKEELKNSIQTINEMIDEITREIFFKEAELAEQIMFVSTKADVSVFKDQKGEHIL